MAAEELHIVNLSGGKDSTAMLLMMLERDMRVDKIICADTGMEFPGMEEHLRKVERYTGRSITYIRHPDGFEHMMFDHVMKKGERKGEAGYGWARPKARWCTSKLKEDLIAKYLRSLSAGAQLVQYIGIAADEPHRVKDLRYPLVEWGVTEKEALEYCYAHGFDWGGLYELFDRVSCWCCPLKNLSELRNLRKFFPDLWERLLDMDARSYNSFKINSTVAQLEKRFAAEDAQMRLDF